MANAKFVEWEKRYTGWVAIEVTPNKVINLLLRAENNLLHVNDDNELYCDLQTANGVTPSSNFEVWVTTGTVQASDGRPQNWLLLHYEATSWAYAQWLCGADGKIYFDNWTGTFKQVYYSEDVDALIAQLRSEISAVWYSGEYDDLLNRPAVAHISYSEEQWEWIVEWTLKDNTMVMITPFNWTVPPTLSIDGKSYIVLGNEWTALNVYWNEPLVWIYQIDKSNNNLNYITTFLRKPDTALSATSTNTVENKVVKAALDLKANDADISTVGKSNDYNDLDNKPTIWAWVTTITRNNTQIGTIWANQTNNGSINISVPTATSEITNDTWYITSAVDDLDNYMLSTNVQAGLDSKVNLSTTYNMCEVTANEDGSLNEDFVNWVLSNTMQVIRNSIDKLFLRKANKNVTDALEANKASITYVNELVGSSLWVQTRVVEELPAVWSSQFIYLVPDDPQNPTYYTKYVWDTTNQNYVNLWTTSIDLSNYVTLDWTQTITGIKNFTTSPSVPSKSTSAGNNATTIATEAQVYRKQDTLTAWSNITINGTTISATDTTYSSLSAESGGTDVSLVTTGEKYVWNNKQDAIADLSTIRAGAMLWASSVQPNDNVSSLVNDAWYLTASALAGKATATNLWLVKLWSNTVQTTAANAVTSEWSRTYAVQLNSSDQAVVNVPWTDTIQAIDDRLDTTSLNPVQNVVITNAINSKQDTLSAGTGISLASDTVTNTGVITVNGNSGTVTVNDVKISSTEPSSPTAWMVWYDTTNNLLKSYNGTAWSAVGAVLSVNGQTGNVTVQATLSNITSSEIKTGTATTQKSVTAAALAWAMPVLSTQANNVLTSWMKIWVGTESNYSSLGTYDNSTIYLTY